MNIKTFFLIYIIFIFKNYNTKKIKLSKFKNILLKISSILEKINIMYIHQFNMTICILKKKKIVILICLLKFDNTYLEIEPLFSFFFFYMVHIEHN